MAIRFLPDELVLDIHKSLIQMFGGSHGVRDRGLLLSALAQPKMTFRGKFVHRTIFEKAAAYGYHLCANHPFVDGNKRVAFMVMFLFLENSGYSFETPEREVYETMIAVAPGNMKAPPLAEWLRTRSKRKTR